VVVAMDTQIESILDRVEQALGRADLECACEALGRLVIPGPCPGPAEPLLARVKATALEQIKRSMDEGRLDQAGRLLDKLKALAQGERPADPAPETASAAIPVGLKTGEGPDQGLILQIDGVGSFLIFLSASVSVGPITSPKRPSLGLLADPNLPTVKICRCEDDYFVSGPKPAQEGQATGRLLVDGDRISLSDRCYLKFHMPNRASTTAVLTLVGVRLPRCDVQSILLADRDILIGPTKAHHIRAVLLDRTVVLLVREGRLWTMSQPTLLKQGPLADQASPLDLDRPVRVGPLSFVVTAWKPEV
jgi:hypothetical protein